MTYILIRQFKGENGREKHARGNGKGKQIPEDLHATIRGKTFLVIDLFVVEHCTNEIVNAVKKKEKKEKTRDA